MRILTALVPLFGVLVAFSTPSAAKADRCLDGLGSALVAGGFSGSVDCKRDELFLTYVGRVQEFGRTFDIYSYRYRLKPACPECAVHGGHRIIFMERGRYVGQYRADFVQVAVRNRHLVIVGTAFPDAEPIKVGFTKQGPPKRLWAGGEVLTFFR